ncbi:MAG: hypothetical protein JRM99_01515 [Nitrososphaerota archaeon]|nr:hypothetical protein [Nitrososphaerota archaeon]
MTDNRTFIVILGGLFTAIGVVIWRLDFAIDNPGAQAAANEGATLALVAGIVAVSAALMRLVASTKRRER